MGKLWPVRCRLHEILFFSTIFSYLFIKCSSIYQKKLNTRDQSMIHGKQLILTAYGTYFRMLIYMRSVSFNLIQQQRTTGDGISWTETPGIPRQANYLKCLNIFCKNHLFPLNIHCSLSEILLVVSYQIDIFEM